MKRAPGNRKKRKNSWNFFLSVHKPLFDKSLPDNFIFIRSNQQCAEFVEFNKIKSNLHKIKTAVHPKAPQKPIEIKNLFEGDENVAMGPYMFSDVDGYDEKKIYYGTVIKKHFAFTVFVFWSIVDIVRTLPKPQRTFMCDATFKIVPYGEYKQLFIIYIEYQEKVFPMIFVLMSNKTEEIYKNVFLYIEKHVIKLDPASFLTDYEVAMRKAISYVYPGLHMKACWFHYCQCVRRNAQKFGDFLKELSKRTDAYRLQRKFMSLPLLKPEQIAETFEILKEEAATKHGTLFEDFLIYFQRQWLAKVNKNYQFFYYYSR